MVFNPRGVWLNVLVERIAMIGAALRRPFEKAPMHRHVLLLVVFGCVAHPVSAHAQQNDQATPSVVVVEGKKEAVVKKLDKTVYDASNMPRAANGTAQDVLQSTPELLVSSDGQISVKGNSRVTVLIDGKPTAMMSGSDEERAVALQTMNGTDIASIEVITNPSAAYNANGGAIVNIVLKRNRKPGPNAQIQGSASDQGLWNLATSGDVTRNNISVHGSLGYRRDGNLKLRESVVDWNNPLNGETGQTRQSSEVFVHRAVESAALGIDDALSDTDNLSLSARYNQRRSRPVFDVLSEVRSDSDTSIYHRISDGPNTQSDKSVSLSYSHQDHGTALKAMAQHSDTIGLIDKSYRDLFLEPMRPTDYSHGVTKPKRRLDQATLDWSRLSNNYGQLGIGLDFQRKTDDIYNYQASVDPSTDVELIDPNTTNSFAVTTTVSAFYLTDKIRYEKWEALLGGRFEHMGLQVSPMENATGIEHWQAFNPSVHLQYAASEKVDLTLSYRRSLQMPDPRDLNPFTTYIDAQNLSRGNPALKPQRLTFCEIGSNFDGKPVRSSLNAFYRTSSNTVTDERSFADNVLITSKQNGGRARSVGITGSFDWTVSPQLSLGADGGGYSIVLHTPDLFGPVRQDGLAGYINLRAAYSRGDENLSLDAHFQSSTITPLGRAGATNNVNLSWKHQLSKTFSLTVNANDIFDGSKRTYRTNANTFHQVGFDHFVAQRIYVGFSKKFE